HRDEDRIRHVPVELPGDLEGDRLLSLGHVRVEPGGPVVPVELLGGAEAATTASAAAALPVEAVVITPTLRSSALTRASAEARSLSDPVGCTPSSLIQTSATPAALANRGDRERGVPPMRR